MVAVVRDSVSSAQAVWWPLCAIQFRAHRLSGGRRARFNFERTGCPVAVVRDSISSAQAVWWPLCALSSTGSSVHLLPTERSRRHFEAEGQRSRKRSEE